MDSNGQGMLKLSVREKLDFFPSFSNESGLQKELRLYDAVLRETIEIPDMEEGVMFLEEGAESSLRKAPLERHLSSLKTGLGSSSGPSILAFGSVASRLPVTRSDPSSDTFPFLSCPGWGAQGVELHA